MKTKKARGLTLAERNIKQKKLYQKGDGQSSPNLKELLGVLLLRLVTGQAQPDGLQQFDRLLRQLYAGGAL